MAEAKPLAGTDHKRPFPEAVDELEQLCRVIEGQIRSNKLFLETFLQENGAEEEE